MRPIIILICAAWLVLEAPATTVTPGTAQGVYVFTGNFVTPERTFRGVMIVKGDSIACIGRACAVPADATRIEVDDGYIFPGFIDAHQHMSSNIAPLWKNTRKYAERYAWQKDPDHLAAMAPQRKYVSTEQGWCDAERFAEIRQLISGVTTIQGAGRNRPCIHGLIRNADSAHDLPLPETRVVQYIPDVRLFDLNIDWSVTRCLAIHLGEGVDEYTRKELDILGEKHLLRPETLIIHGTAFGPPEFARMAKTGAKLVWSPQSNIALYGKSMNVEAAVRAGVEVSLGVDWSPSGSHDILAELKVANQVNRRQMHSVIGKDEWVSMITLRPARGLSLDDYVGSLAGGKIADITILKERARTANGSLLKNELKDVEMVFVGGRLRYGDRLVVDRILPGACEPITVEGIANRHCVADP